MKSALDNGIEVERVWVMISFRTSTIVIFLVLTSFVFAKPPFLKVFTEAYKISPNSPLGKAKCLSCHLPPAPPRRNSYGLSVQAAMEAVNARILTAEILKKVEKKDSDGDGVSSLIEIRAGTLPNDKRSKPSKRVAFEWLGGVAFVGFGMLGRGRKRSSQVLIH